MPTQVQLVIDLDNDGAVKGVNQLSSQFDKLGKDANTSARKGSEGFKQLDTATKKARDSAQLLAQTFGIALPQSIEKIIAKTPGLSTALSAAFKTSAVVGVGVAIGEAARNFDTFYGKAKNTGQDVVAGFEKMGRAVAGLAGVKLPKWATSFIDAANKRDTDEFLESLRDKLRAAGEAADAAGVTGIGQITAGLKASNQELDAFQVKFKKTIEDAIGRDTPASRNILKLASPLFDQIRAANKDAASKTIAQVTQETLFSASQSLLQAQASAAHGSEQIELEYQAKLKDIEQQVKLSNIDVADEQLAADTDRTAKLVQLRRDAEDQIYQAEQQASLDSVSQWESANAQIVANFDSTNRQIRRSLSDHVIDGDQANKLREANWNSTNARMARQYSQDFQSLYNDITSGNIGQRIKSQMQKFFFDIAGEWYSAIVDKRHGDNSALSFIGSILGIGGLGSSLPPQGSASSRVIYNGVPISGGSGSTGINDFGTPNAAASLFSLGGQGSVGGFGASSALASTGGFGAGLSNYLGGYSLNTPSVSDSSAQSYSPNYVSLSSAGVSSALKASTVSKLLPSALGILGTSIGGPFGTAATVLSLGAILAAKGGTLGALAGAFAAPLASGFLGYGLGSKYGPVAGSLGGAGLGAATSLGFALATGAALAPATFGLSILVGALAGLFGGLFGGSKRKRQAEQLAQQTISQIAALNNQYKGFSIDYASAISGLEGIRTQTYPQFDQLKGEGRSAWQNTVLPKLNSAEQEINSINIERARRSTLLFGPPQFATGGQFRTGTGDAGYAVLHDGEVVMSRKAVETYGSKNLLAMNQAARSGSSAPIGGDQIHLTINAIDSRSFEHYLTRNGGWKVIRHLARRDRHEGRGRM